MIRLNKNIAKRFNNGLRLVQSLRDIIILSLFSILLFFAGGCSSASKKQVVTPLPQETYSEPSVKPVVVQNLETNKAAVFEKSQTVVKPSSPLTNNVLARPKPVLTQLDTITNESIAISYEKNNGFSQCVAKNEGRFLVVYSDKQYVNYDGIKIDLGYIPSWGNGRCYLNEAEIRSTIMPLLKPSIKYFPKTTTVVIDPGHGGSDPGSTSIYNRKPEKDYTLDIARRLYSLLTAGGWNVVLTRTNDVRVERASRVAISEKAGANIFISIHLNYFEKSKSVSGIETYCLTPTGLPSGFNRGFADNVENVYSNNGYDRQNILLAAQIQSALVRGLNSVDRGVKRARFLEVLQNQKCAAVLIEAGFLSNVREATLLDSEQHRQMIAESIYKGIVKFCGSN